MISAYCSLVTDDCLPTQMGKLFLPKERRKNKFPILSILKSVLIRQKSELINQVKLYYLLLFTDYWLLVTDYWLLITDY